MLRTQNSIQGFSLLLLTASLTAVSGCASFALHEDAPKNTVLTGQWNGTLAVPEEFSSNRGMLDPSCDRDVHGAENFKLRVSQSAQDIQVEGHLHCSLHGKAVYSAAIPLSHLELRGEDLLLNGVKVGTATPVYFSMVVGGGKLTIVKYPTWEKMFYEANSGSSDSPIALSGVFENRENFADEKAAPTAPAVRVPANTSKTD
jgi:hypothetical protein